ncbi:MAG: hypothetical protein M3Q48_01740, partial [Actinomycetota bacterium]|nr:hypothetical protein [Actinomycetota bacterium]
MPRPLLVLATAVAAVAPGPAGAAVPVLVIEGKGFGHGVGMAQDGAYWMGRGGASTTQILNHFYPGTRPGRAGGEVRVAVFTAAGNQTVLAFPAGGEVRDTRGAARSPGFPVRVPPGGRARVRFEGGRYTAEVVGGAASPRPPVGRRAAGASATAGPAQERATLERATQEQATTTTTALLPLPKPTALPPTTPPDAPVPTT